MKKTKTYYMTWTARNKNGELRKRAKRHIDRFGGSKYSLPKCHRLMLSRFFAKNVSTRLIVPIICTRYSPQNGKK